MQPDFWHQRWHDQQIGFHQDTPTPLMLKHWPSLGIAPGSRVFVPRGPDRLEAGDLVILFVREEELGTVQLLFPGRDAPA